MDLDWICMPVFDLSGETCFKVQYECSGISSCGEGCADGGDSTETPPRDLAIMESRSARGINAKRQYKCSSFIRGIMITRNQTWGCVDNSLPYFSVAL